MSRPESSGLLLFFFTFPYATVLTAFPLGYTIRYRMEKDLGRNDWLKVARLELLEGGVEAVRVEKLARALRVTKGSFYWHFKDREELLDLLLREWESEAAEIAGHLGQGSSREKTTKLLQLLEERARLSEQGDVPSDAAIFAWASTSPEVARRVNRCEL